MSVGDLHTYVRQTPGEVSVGDLHTDVRQTPEEMSFGDLHTLCEADSRGSVGDLHTLCEVDSWRRCLPQVRPS